MRSSRILLAIALLSGVAALIAPPPLTAQASPQYTLRVNGETVVSTRPPVRLAGEWFVPLAPVARALGVELKIDGTAQSFRIVRGDGVSAIYDGASGRILQGAVMAAQVANFRQVQLNVGEENILFPLDGVVALFGVMVREDMDQQTLEIESSLSGGSGGSEPSSPRFQLASLEDRFALATNGRVWQQSFNLRGQSLLGSNRLSGTVDLSRGSDGGFLSFRQGFLRLETPAHRAVTAGDQGTYIGVDALSNTVRGLGYEWRWGGFTTNVYGGRAASSISSALGSSGLAAYDATLGGFGLHRKTKKLDFALSGNAFRGTLRSGTTIGAGFSTVYGRNELKVQGLTGYFSGTSLRSELRFVDPNAVPSTTGSASLESPATAAATPGSVVQVEQPAGQVKGAGYGLSVVDTFIPFRSRILSFTGLWERYSRNFLILREESRFSAASRKSLSATLQPIRYISFTGSIHRSAALLGDPNKERGYTYGVNGSTPGRVPIQPGYFRSVQLNSDSAGRFVLSQYSLQMPHVGRFTGGAVFSEIQFAGVRSRVATENLTADLKRFGRLGFHDQMQFASNHNYGVDWFRELRNKGTYFMGGLERQTTIGRRPGFAPVAGFRIPLLHGQSLTVWYFSVRGSGLFRFELGGPLVRKREVLSVSNSQTVMVVPASLGGQIYHDVDLDGRFTQGTDRPLSSMKVWLDEETASTTDAGGFFRFEGITTGTHRLRVDTATLSARLVFAVDDLKVAVMPYRLNRQDFRAIPSGRLQGTVSLLNKDESGRDRVVPIPDAHILVSGNRDTFSEGDGMFVLGDLPPGTYQLRLDPTSIPAGFASRPVMRTAEVKPGKSAEGLDFRLERPVIIKPAPAIVSRSNAAGSPASFDRDAK